MISFLKSFREVIVSSNLRETKGYSPGFFFCGPKKSSEKSKPFKSIRKEKSNGTCFSCSLVKHFWPAVDVFDPQAPTKVFAVSYKLS